MAAKMDMIGTLVLIRHLLDKRVIPVTNLPATGSTEDERQRDYRSARRPTIRRYTIRITTAPMMDAIQPIQLSPVPMPSARDRKAASRAPAIPSNMVTTIHPGSFPGITSLDRKRNRLNNSHYYQHRK